MTNHPAATEAPLVTVIVPAYNAERDLPTCLTALSNQENAPAFEVIVVDDGSTDRTAEVAEAAGAIVLRQANRGPGEARNHGAAAARGTILIFTDADCDPDSRFLRNMATAFQDSAVDGALGAYRTRQQSLVARHLQIEFTYNYRKLHKHQTIDHVPTHAAAYRAAAFRDAGGFRPHYRGASQEDIDLSYRLAATGKRLVFWPSAVVYHRHPATLRGYLRQKYARAKWKVLLYAEHPSKAATDTYTSQVLKLQLVLLLGLAAVAAGAIAAASLRLTTPVPGWSALVLAGAFLASTAAQAIHAAREDSPRLGMLSPGFALARALAFMAGLVGGLLLLARHRDAGSHRESGASDRSSRGGAGGHAS